MTNEELKLRITELFPQAAIDENGEWINILIPSADLPDIALQLKQTKDLDFDFLFCLTCIDWKTRLTMVYHFTSTTYRHSLVVKTDLDIKAPETVSLSNLWRTAEFHEREVYEMFGVRFNNHPDLRLLILPDGWEGKNPMRKDFDDPVNMIKL